MGESLIPNASIIPTTPTVAFPEQPWEIKTERTYEDYIVECAIRMFTNTNFDISTSKVSIIAKECISRSKVLIDGLVKMGFIKK